MLASERPGLLGFLRKRLSHSPARYAILELAELVDVVPEKLAATFKKAAADLDELEAIKGRWSQPDQIVASPNVAALYVVAQARAQRDLGITRARRLEATLRRLERAYDDFDRVRTHRWITRFLAEPATVSRSRGESED